MKRIVLIAFVVLATLIGGCYTLSIHPLYNENTLTFEPGFVGIWGDPKNDTETWAFEKSGDNSYRLVVRDKGIKKSSANDYELLTDIDPLNDGIFKAHLVKLDKYLFMDLYPEESQKSNDYYNSHVIPAHSFVRIWYDSDHLKLASLDMDWLKKGIENRDIEIKHERRGDTIVLTAPTIELQKFAVKYADKAFTDIDEAYKLK